MADDNGLPWATSMSWDLPNIAPGPLAQLRRAEAAEQAREQREHDERAARAEDRLEAWRMRRMTELAMAGTEFDPGNDATLVEDPLEQMERVFAHQDRESARLERAALRSVGLAGSYGHHFGDGPVLSSGASAPSAPETSDSGATSIARSGPLAKVRELLHRGGATPCGCPTCVSVRAARYQEKHQ